MKPFWEPRYRKVTRVHMAGKALFYSGNSALCWKYPRALDPDFRTLNWHEVTCPRCLALKPADVKAREEADEAEQDRSSW